MADDKYFYMMFKENFFESDDLILLESMENGYLYSNILLKLYLKSLKDKGKLMYKDKIPYNTNMLSKLTRHNIDVVEKAIKIFVDMGIIEILSNGAIYMLEIENYIGSSSTHADRQREYDRRIASEKKKLLPEKTKISDKKSDKVSSKKSDVHINTELNINLDTNLDSNTEIKTKPQKKNRKQKIEISQEIMSEWDGYLEMRKSIKSPMTEYAQSLALAELENLAPGNYEQQRKIIQQSIIRSWKGLFPLQSNNIHKEIKQQESGNPFLDMYRSGEFSEQ